MTPPLPFYVQPDDAPAKREILRAALRLFSEHGLAGTSIRDIARESGYTNPALYRHFPSKEALALHLFETCHERVWKTCDAALRAGGTFDEKLERYVAAWLGLFEAYPDVLAFLSDSARVLWPKAKASVRRRTMIGLGRRLMREAPRVGAGEVDVDVAAAGMQGTLAELARMIHVGAAPGPPSSWQSRLVTLFHRLAG